MTWFRYHYVDWLVGEFDAAATARPHVPLDRRRTTGPTDAAFVVAARRRPGPGRRAGPPRHGDRCVGRFGLLTVRRDSSVAMTDREQRASRGAMISPVRALLNRMDPNPQFWFAVLVLSVATSFGASWLARTFDLPGGPDWWGPGGAGMFPFAADMYLAFRTGPDDD